jgi:hypothetical protein
MEEEIKAGDRVYLKEHLPKVSEGTVDEVWRSDDVQSGVLMASVVWDVSGCIGEGPASDLGLVSEAGSSGQR